MCAARAQVKTVLTKQYMTSQRLPALCAVMITPMTQTTMFIIFPLRKGNWRAPTRLVAVTAAVGTSGACTAQSAGSGTAEMASPRRRDSSAGTTCGPGAGPIVTAGPAPTTPPKGCQLPGPTERCRCPRPPASKRQPAAREVPDTVPSPTRCLQGWCSGLVCRVGMSIDGRRERSPSGREEHGAAVLANHSGDICHAQPSLATGKFSPVSGSRATPGSVRSVCCCGWFAPRAWHHAPGTPHLAPRRGMPGGPESACSPSYFALARCWPWCWESGSALVPAAGFCTEANQFVGAVAVRLDA